MSQLKAAHLRPEDPISTLPANVSAFQVPLEVIDYRWRKAPNKMVRQGKIRWTGTPAEDTTWEDLEDLHRCFPRAPTWVPLRILSFRDKTTWRTTVRQGLTHWSYSSADKAKWENISRLKHHFPDAPAWGQVVFQDEGIVSNTQETAADTTTTSETGPP